MNNKTNIALAAGVLALATAWIATGILSPQKEDEGAADTNEVVEVVTAPLVYAPYVSSVRLSGRTEAKFTVDATARTAGIVIDLPVREGSFVEEGDVIAELSDEARAAAVAEARAAVEEARAQLVAGEELAERGVLPSLTLEQRRASLASAESLLMRATSEEARGVVLAPVKGVLDRLLAEPGQSVGIGDKIASVLDLDPLVVAGYASERTVGRIDIGASAKVNTLNGQKLDAKVTFVSRGADASTRTFRVEAEAPNPDARVVAGLTAEMLVDTAPRPAARVPRSAITLSDLGEIGVMLVDAQSRAEFAKADIVGDEGESFWIQGPRDGADVIVVGQEFVAHGAPVHAVRRPAAGGGSSDVAALPGANVIAE